MKNGSINWFLCIQFGTWLITKKNCFMRFIHEKRDISVLGSVLTSRFSTLTDGLFAYLGSQYLNRLPGPSWTRHPLYRLEGAEMSTLLIWNWWSFFWGTNVITPRSFLITPWISSEGDPYTPSEHHLQTFLYTPTFLSSFSRSLQKNHRISAT